MIRGVGTAVVTLLLVVLIIYLSYICSKFIGKGYGVRKRSGFMKLIDQMAVGQDKSIAVIQAGVHYYLIGIASSGITVLAELTEEDLTALPNESDLVSGAGQPVEFKQILEKIQNLNKWKK